MISNEMLEEVIYYSDKYKYIEKDLIIKIVEDIVNSETDDIKKRFNEVVFDDITWSRDVVCSYRINMGNIIVDYEKLINQLNQEKSLSFLQANLEILINLLHEIEHLKEQDKSKKSLFESFLHSYSSIEIFDSLAEEKLKFFEKILPLDLYQKKLEKISERNYLKIYNKIPSERIATINSHKSLFDSLNNYEGFKEKYKKAFIYINKEYLNQYYMGYKTNCSNVPLIDYFNFIGMVELLENLDFYSENIRIFKILSSKEFSIEDRMLYGLPITLKETKILNKKILMK